MLAQIIIGTSLLLVTILIAALCGYLMEVAVARLHRWLMREPHAPKLVLVILASALGVLAFFSAGVWVWAVAFRLLGIFGTFEEALYFALVSFTTLGFGDVLLPLEWRLLAGIAAANGLLAIGLMTAILVEALRHVRIGQIETRRARRG